MLVISDASPINVLIRIRCVDLLHRLFGQVVIPPAVADELTRVETPEAVRNWVNASPEWLTIRAPSFVDPGVARDPGEREAICLARELKADLLLVDDLKARSAAKRLGIRTTGTLGILELAAHSKLVLLTDVLEDLRATDFRISENLLTDALERERLRRESDV